MYIIIIGCGRMGSTLAKELSLEGHDVSIIDRDKERLNVLGSGFNGQRIKGIEFDNDVLLDAGIERADVFLAMTPDDNINITAAQIAQNLYTVPRVIARICDPSKDYIYEKLSIETICPTRLGAYILKGRITSGEIQVIASLNHDVEILRIAISKNRHKSVKEIEDKYSCIISGIVRGSHAILPKADDSINIGDVIVCTIDVKNKQRLISAFVKEMTA